MTRAWHEHGCVPYADLLNHNTTSKMSLKYIKSGYDSPASKSFPDFSIMQNGNKYDVGEEIFNNYWKILKNSQEFLEILNKFSYKLLQFQEFLRIPKNSWHFLWILQEFLRVMNDSYGFFKNS